MPHKQQAIGIFDSGSGGVSVAKALHDLLPAEHLVYLADLAHFPYGDKTAQQVQDYSLALTDYLLAKNCKMIIIACGTASSAASQLLRGYLATEKIVVVDAISPVVQFVKHRYQNQTIGLIATPRTVASNVYQEQLAAADITLHAVAAPLLAPAIEAQLSGEQHDYHDLLAFYLKTLPKIEALILGSTHYPLIKGHLEQYYQHSMELIDIAELIAQAAQKVLQEKNLLADATQIGTQEFYTTRVSAALQQVVEKFFGSHSLNLCELNHAKI